MYRLTALGARSLKLSCQQDHAVWNALGNNLSHTFLLASNVTGNLQLFFACC